MSPSCRGGWFVFSYDQVFRFVCASLRILRITFHFLGNFFLRNFIRPLLCDMMTCLRPPKKSIFSTVYPYDGRPSKMLQASYKKFFEVENTHSFSAGLRPVLSGIASLDSLYIIGIVSYGFVADISQLQYKIIDSRFLLQLFSSPLYEGWGLLYESRCLVPASVL